MLPHRVAAVLVDIFSRILHPRVVRFRRFAPSAALHFAAVASPRLGLWQMYAEVRRALQMLHEVDSVLEQLAIFWANSEVSQSTTASCCVRVWSSGCATCHTHHIGKRCSRCLRRSFDLNTCTLFLITCVVPGHA